VHSRERYADIHMPRNTAVGLVMGLLSLALGFGLIWQIWWLAIASFVGMIVSFIVRSFDEDVDYYVPAAEVERIENERHLKMANQG
jgi:cytochrome o ubiquinol oxidase subunit 1